MADDFLAQVRTLNPDLKDYDDQTLAAAIGDQHPDYKPKLAKYFPDTASNVLAKQGAEAPAPPEDDVDPKQAAQQAFAQAHPDINPYALAAKGAAALGSPEAVAERKQMGGYGKLADIGAGVAGSALKMFTPENTAIAATLPVMGPLAGRAAGLGFGAMGAWDTIKSIPELARLWRQGNYDELLRKGTEAGLGAAVSTLLLAHGIKGSGTAPEAQPEAPPPADTSAGEAAVKGHQAVAKALADVAPKSAEAATEAAEAQKAANEGEFPMKEAAFRDPVTGKIYPAGPVHDPNSVPASILHRVEDGFIGKSGRFLTRQEATDLSGAGAASESVAARQTGRMVDTVNTPLTPEELADPDFDPLASKAQNAARRAKQAEFEAAEAADQMRPEEPPEDTRPPIVKGQQGQDVIPNERANPAITQDMVDQAKAQGVDATNPQEFADFLGKFYGLQKPVNVTSVGDVDVSESSQTPHDYQLDLADGGADKVAHEIQHARQVEGQIPQVPEGPGANDQIVGQVTKDIGGAPEDPQKYAANINLNRLQIPDNAKAAIVEYADHLQRQAPVPREQTLSDAQALGMSLEDASKFADATKDLHAKATAARQIEGWAADAYAKAPPEGKDAARKALFSSMQAASDVAANLGRGLGSMAIDAAPNAPARAAIEFAKVLQELEKKGKNVEDLKQKLDVADLSDEAQRLKLRKAMGMRGPFRFKLGYYYVNSLISAIPTWGVKSVSDIATILASPPRTLGGSALNRGVYEIKSALGREAGAMPHPLAETQARAAGMWAATDDALTAFTQGLKTGSTVYSREPPITGLPGKIIGTPMRILGAITDAAHTVGVRGELYEQGMREAVNAGKVGPEAWDHAREYANDPPEDGLAKADKEARIDTLTQPPGKILKSVLHLREQVPGAVLQAPIVLTPQNLVKAAFQTSPLGFADILRDISRGEEVSNAKMGRAALGSMLWYWGYKMADAGRLTGAGPTDPKEFKKKLQSGWRPQSIELNGSYLPLRALGPIGYSLGTIADISEIRKEAPRTANLEDYAVLSADHVMRFALEQPMVQGIADLFELMKNPQYFPTAAGRMAGGFVPSIVARAGAAMDNNQRRIDSFGSAVRARVPIWREGLPPKRDHRGNPIPEPGTPLERFASPVARSEQADLSAPDQVYQDSKIPPISNSIDVYGQRFKLNREDLDHYEQLAGKIVDDKFKAIEQAPSIFNARSEDQQREQVKNIVSSARDAAKWQLVHELKKTGTYQAYVEAATGKSAAKAQANPYNEPLAVVGADKAQKVLDRYGIPSATKPASVPEDLADEFFKELEKQHAMIFHGVVSNPTEVGSLPPEEGRAKVQQLEDLAVRQATKAVLGRAKKLSNAAPKAQNQGAEAP